MNREDKKEFEDVGKRLINDIISQKEIDQSWQAIENETRRRKFGFSYRKALSIGTVAASIAVLLFFIIPNRNISSNDLSAEMFKDSVSYIGNEVLLIADDTQKEIIDEFALKYDTAGKLLTDSEDKTLLAAKLNEIIVPRGKRMNITFSDGTHMHINSRSHVIYPSVFADDKREILVQGEVFLEVAKDSKRPFVVKTKSLDVTVLGTSFNLSAYKEDMETSVVLVEGSVEVKSCDNEKLKIKSNQKLTFQNSEISVKNVDTEEYTAWTRDIMVLNQMQCGEILNRLSQFYGVKIHFDESVSNLKAGGDLNMKNGLNDVLNNLTLTFNLKYTTNADGSISILSE